MSLSEVVNLYDREGLRELLNKLKVKDDTENNNSERKPGTKSISEMAELPPDIKKLLLQDEQ